jgi:hypothetical protein
MSTGRRDDKFSIFVPKDEKSLEVPDHLEIVETDKGGKPKERLQGGAYDPYQKQDVNIGDTARIHRPRVDLRQLSEWIKTTQRVKSLREEDIAAQQAKESKGPLKEARELLKEAKNLFRK